MPITPPLDNKQEPVEEPPATTWLDKATEQSPSAKLLRKLAREKIKVGDVVRVYGSEDRIRENIKLLGPTTTYCMTREEMAEALKDMMEKAERGYYEPLYFREKRVMDTYLSYVGPVCSIQMQEEVKDNDC